MLALLTRKQGELLILRGLIERDVLQSFQVNRCYQNYLDGRNKSLECLLRLDVLRKNSGKMKYQMNSLKCLGQLRKVSPLDKIRQGGHKLGQNFVCSNQANVL